MTARACVLAMALLGVSSTARAQDGGAAPPPCDKQTQAECDFADGTWYFQQRRYDRAAELFKASFASAPLGDTLAMYGAALFHDGRVVLAYEATQHALTMFEERLARATADSNVADQDAYRTRINGARAQLSQIEAKVGRVRVRYSGGSPPPGLVVSRPDHGDVGTPLTVPIAVEPGDGVLRFDYGRGTALEADYAVALGAEVTIEAPRPAGPRRTRTWIGVGTASAGVIALAVSGGLLLSARSDRDAAEAGGCDDLVICATAAGRDAHNRANRSENLALWTAIGGAALVGAAVVLWLTDPAGDQPADRYVSVAAARGGAIAIFHASF